MSADRKDGKALLPDDGQRSLPKVSSSTGSSIGPSPDPRLVKSYPIGSKIQCRVTKVLPVGVEAHPLDAPEVLAFVHRHDWTWLRRIKDLGDHAHVGDYFDARVEGYARVGLVLSRKQCLPDPFEQFKRNHAPGAQVQGRFKLLLNKQAGILLEIGKGEATIDGLVLRSELPPAALDIDGFGLLGGDLISARILRFKDDEVILSIRDQLRRRDAWITSTESQEPVTLQHNPKLGLTLERLYYQQRLAEEPGLCPSTRVLQEIRQILLVEDEESVVTSLRDALIRAGFGVDVAFGSARIGEILRTKPVDLLVLDRNLHGAEGTDLLREDFVLESVRFVCILTGTPSLEVYDWHADLAAQGRLLVLDKPTHPSALFDLLDSLLSKESYSPSRAESDPLDLPLPGDNTEASKWLPHQFGRPEQLDLLLSDLRERYGADYAFVMSYEDGPVFRLIAGNFIDLSREVQQQLELSVVADAIRRREQIFDNPIREEAKDRYQHILEVIPATSFIGFGIAYYDQARYGIFFINAGKRQLRSLTQEERSQLELRVTQHLIEARFAAALVENQTLLLKGLLTSALLHEVGNRLQTLADHSALQVDVAHELGTSSRTLDDEQLVDLLKSTNGISTATRDLSDLVGTFRNLFGTDSTERVRLDRLLENIERTFRSVANREGLHLRVQCEGKLPVVVLNPKLLEQPILNLLLNAKEQMALHGSAMRRIWISVSVTKGDQFPIQIRVRDTGPGIHARDHKRIFDLFFTTKQKGTGLGLFIAQLLVERFGGKIQLENSFLFEGSEFCIYLPSKVIL